MDLLPLTELTHFTASDNQLSNMKVGHSVFVVQLGVGLGHAGEHWGQVTTPFYAILIVTNFFISRVYPALRLRN